MLFACLERKMHNKIWMKQNLLLLQFLFGPLKIIKKLIIKNTKMNESNKITNYKELYEKVSFIVI